MMHKPSETEHNSTERTDWSTVFQKVSLKDIDAFFSSFSTLPSLPEKFFEDLQNLSDADLRKQYPQALQFLDESVKRLQDPEFLKQLENPNVQVAFRAFYSKLLYLTRKETISSGFDDPATICKATQNATELQILLCQVEEIGRTLINELKNIFSGKNEGNKMALQEKLRIASMGALIALPNIFMTGESLAAVRPLAEPGQNTSQPASGGGGTNVESGMLDITPYHIFFAATLAHLIRNALVKKENELNWRIPAGAGVFMVIYNKFPWVRDQLVEKFDSIPDYLFSGYSGSLLALILVLGHAGVFRKKEKKEESKGK